MARGAAAAWRHVSHPCIRTGSAPVNVSSRPSWSYWVRECPGKNLFVAAQQRRNNLRALSPPRRVRSVKQPAPVRAPAQMSTPPGSPERKHSWGAVKVGQVFKLPVAAACTPGTPAHVVRVVSESKRRVQVAVRSPLPLRGNGRPGFRRAARARARRARRAQRAQRASSGCCARNRRDRRPQCLSARVRRASSLRAQACHSAGLHAPPGRQPEPALARRSRTSPTSWCGWRATTSAFGSAKGALAGTDSHRGSASPRVPPPRAAPRSPPARPPAARSAWHWPRPLRCAASGGVRQAARAMRHLAAPARLGTVQLPRGAISPFPAIWPDSGLTRRLPPGAQRGRGSGAGTVRPGQRRHNVRRRRRSCRRRRGE